MKKYLLFLIFIAGALVSFAVIGSSNPTPETSSEPRTAEQRAAREQKRAERLETYAKTIDSIVLARSFQFNPQTMQQEPAGAMRIISNPHYEVGVWESTVDICLPYIKGFVPPYYLTVINYTMPTVENYTTEQTPEGWIVRFETSLFTASTYTFNFEISTKIGGATLTITNPWYNPVQYTGTISQLY